MSLLDDGRDTVTLYPEKVVNDVLDNPGKRVPDLDNPVTLTGRMQPVSFSETDANGQQVQSRWRFVTRSFPAGAWAKVTWNGRDFDVVAEAARRNGSDVTKHVTVILQARKPEVVS
jgi:hypothetical protein